jgi:signal transduction histidine kinase
VERVDGLLAIVNDLLELAKMREGRARAPWSRNVNVNQLLADLFDALEPYAEERRVRLVPDFQGVAILDWGIPPDLVYAFENLMQNAIKYSHEGGEVTVRLRVMGDMLTVEVQDRGIGIPEDLLEDVLLEFVRAPNAKKHAPEGTGLGLAIAREAVEAHGGTLVLRSREGEGTTAIVSLPLHGRPETT